MRTDQTLQSAHGSVQIAFQTWRRRAGGRFWSHIEVIKAGEYSDDTQLLLATARSLEHHSDWWRYFCWRELPLWLLYERGGGRAMCAAAQQWQSGTPPWHSTRSDENLRRYFDAGGNGVAMRVLPHALLQEQSSEILCQQIVMNGVATHGHPRALLGAQLYGYAVWTAARLSQPLEFGQLIDHLLDDWQVWGEFPRWNSECNEWLAAADQVTQNGYLKVWKDVVEELCGGLNICQRAMTRGALSIDQSVLEQLGCFDKRVSGAGTVGALAAIYLASRYAADPTTGLLEAAFAQGADTDTIAAMTGGLMGSLLGKEWIPNEWESVQDREYIAQLANSLTRIRATECSGLGSRDGSWSNQLTKQVMEELKAGVDSIHIGPLGRCQVRDEIEHEPIARSVAAGSWLLRTESGQTIYVKRLERLQQETPTPLSRAPQKGVEHQRERDVHSSQRVLDPGIYVNLFEVILQEESAEVMIAERRKFPSMRALREKLAQLDVSVYAWDDAAFGYGAQADILSDFGFTRETILLRDHPRLTEQMILAGYSHSLESAGYTCTWDKGVVKAYQFERPLFETRMGVKMFRGFEIRGQFFFDNEEGQIVFGVTIDAVFAYRGQNNQPLSVAEVVAQCGNQVLKQLRQEQGELAPRGEINLEVSRQRLLRQTLPFIDARHSFVLPCGVAAELSLSPARVVLVDGELHE